ncbi:CTD small phosphatase-like protein 2-B isoform X2 [Python bivittatus]|uniref:Mitochondrial import inner membrane translocase subunit TIM50 n=1 Tax=Python bivittatus TaxID=176946 RepID=A0A9F5N0N2_PYTBI|nr:CTD small phosphatase-like protein 2-B isoform X2 [Python bivittatus]
MYKNTGLDFSSTPSFKGAAIEHEGSKPAEEGSLKQLLEMFPSCSWEPQNMTAGCVPFESYFSFSGVTDLESPKLPTEKPQGDATYLGETLQGAPSGVDALNMFTHPRVIQKLQMRSIPRKMRRTPKNTLVLEVEGTLALSSLTVVSDNASTFITPFQDRYYQVSIKLRPYLPEFLEALAKIYEIFAFTTAKRDYADKILKVLGPRRKLIRHQLYQEDCLCSHGSYVKDLSILERDLDRTVAVATYLQAFPYQMSNVVVIPKWEGDSQDKELLHLIPALQTISQAVS